MAKKQYSILLPFAGFYYSIHQYILDNELNSLLSDDSGTVNYNLVDRATFDWDSVHSDYAREYCKNLNHSTGLNFEFEQLTSPKEYNFTTDRIFALIDEITLMEIVKGCSKETLNKTARDWFTSRDGFTSFYSNNVKSWGNVKDWDYNQLGCLLAAYLVDSECIQDEYELMENSECNGFITELLFKHSANLNRLATIQRYLIDRDARAYCL